MIGAWVALSVSIIIGCLSIAFALNRLAKVLENIHPTTIIQNHGGGISDRSFVNDDKESNAIEETDNSEMIKNLTAIQARAFDSPPIVASGNSGTEIDDSDDIRSSADRLSRNLNGE